MAHGMIDGSVWPVKVDFSVINVPGTGQEQITQRTLTKGRPSCVVLLPGNAAPAAPGAAAAGAAAVAP